MQSEDTNRSAVSNNSVIQERISEAELYLMQGLFDEARQIYQDLLDDLGSLREDAPLNPAGEPSFETHRTFIQQQLEMIVHQEAEFLGQSPESESAAPPPRQDATDLESRSQGGAFFSRGQAFLDLGLFHEAIQELQSAARLDYQPAECAVQISRAYLQSGQHEEGLQVLEDACRSEDLSSPERSRLWVETAMAHEAAGDAERALKLYRELAEIEPQHPIAVGKLNSLAKRSHRLSKVSHRDPDHQTSTAKLKTPTSGRLLSRGRTLLDLELADNLAYHVGEQLGQDEIHQIFRVKEVPGDTTCVAKILLPHIALEANVRDFITRWAYEQTTMENRNITRVRDVAEYEGKYYLITEDYQTTLEELLGHQGQLPLAEAVRLARALLNALAYAHSHRGSDDTLRKIFHLNLNPRQVLMSGDTATIKVADFGLSLQLEGMLGFAPTYKERSAFELSYMAPEQFDRSPRRMPNKMRQASDLYAFGLIFYQMITGKLPFEGPSPEDFKTQHTEKYPVPPRVYVSSIPAKLDEAILKCLHKDPKKRWRTPTELDLAVEKIRFPS